MSISGAQEAIFSGGTDIGATIDSGGVQFVFTAVTASGTIVNGGLENAGFISGAVSSAGGMAIQTTVESGGVLDLFSGGKAIGTRITSGGVEVVSSGGTGISATLTGNETTTATFGVEVVVSGGK